MAQRGRKPKVQTAVANVDYSKLLKEDQVKYESKIKDLYKSLADIKCVINVALREIGFIDECDTLAEAAFRGGKAYVSLDAANDKLETVLDEIHTEQDLDHWEDVSEDY
jgi:hypothetical protein